MNKKIDVVVKYFYPVTAGIETNIMETYSILAKNGWDVTIHTSKDTYTQKGHLPEHEVINGLKIVRYKFSKFGFFPNIKWDITGSVCLHNFDIFPHLRILLFTLYQKLIKRKTYSLFLTPHGGYNPEWKVFSKAEAILKSLYTYTIGTLLINLAVDGVRAVSEWEKIEMHKKGVRTKEIRLISNGLQKEAYEDNEKYVTQEFKETVKQLGRYIVQIGRIYPIKNFADTIKALPLVNNDVTFVIVGPVQDSEYNKYLHDLVKELNLENRVKFMGVVKGHEKYYLLKQAQAMVHMALWEANCNVVHEAMSQYLPCIVANSTGMKFQIKNEDNGYILPLGDVQKLAETINNVLIQRQSPQIKTMSEKNMKYVQDHSWEKVAIRMGQFYVDHSTKI